ncbi:hypothetical protein HKX48_006976 [Thoreauomyces humboldtii]|nr:hypothetical protein HKX48_006976 [Thoreauomyces humboldtii]
MDDLVPAEDSRSLAALKNSWNDVKQLHVNLLTVLLVLVPRISASSDAWGPISAILDSVAQALDSGCFVVRQISEAELAIQPEPGPIESHRMYEPHQLQFLASADALQHQLQEIKTKVLICAQDIKSPAVSDTSDMRPVIRNFDIIEQDISTLLASYRISRDLLLASQDPVSTQAESLEASEEVADDCASEDAEATHDSLEADMKLAEGPEAVYEDYSEDVIRPSSKLSRAERMEIQKQKRTVEIVRKSERLNQETLLSELKNVLQLRVSTD